jgi:hypothetical protein
LWLLQWLLWDAEPVPFWLSPAYVLPRTLRYSLVDNPKKPGTSTIRVYKPLAMWGEPTFDQELNNELLAIMASPDYVADQYKLGGVWMRDKSGKQFKVCFCSVNLAASAMVRALILGPSTVYY